MSTEIEKISYLSLSKYPRQVAGASGLEMPRNKLSKISKTYQRQFVPGLRALACCPTPWNSPNRQFA